MATWQNTLNSVGPANSLFGISRFFDGRFFITKRGHLGVGINIRGTDPENMTPDILVSHAREVASAMRRLPEEVRLYQYLIKRKGQRIAREASYPNDIIAETVNARASSIESRGFYRIDIAWMIVYENDALLDARRKMSLQSRSMYRMLLRDVNRSAQALVSRVSAFIDETQSLLGGSLMSSAEMFRFFRRLVNLDDSVAESLEWTPEQCVDRYLLDEAIGCHREGLEVSENISKDAFRVLTMREPLTLTSPNTFKEILDAPCGLIFCNEFKVVPVQQAVATALSAENYFKTGSWASTMMGLGRLIAARFNTDKMQPDTAALSNAIEAGEILKRINSGDMLGQMSTTVILHAENARTVQEAAGTVLRAFGRFGGSAVTETYNALNAYRAMIPGSPCANFRRLWMLQSYFDEMSLSYAPSAGDARNRFLDCEYVVAAETNSKTVHYVTIHEDDVANLLMIGTTGAGKSVLSNALIDGFQKIEPRVLVLDMGNSYYHTCKKHDGVYASLNLSTDKKWLVNPFSVQRTEDSYAFQQALVKMLLANGGYQVGWQDNRPIEEAIGEIYTRPEDSRRLSNLKLPDHLREALYPWTHGQYARIFDNVEDNLSISHFQVFELGDMEKHPLVLEPLFFYIFMRQQAVVEDPKIRATFKLLWADEVWRFLENATCRRQFVGAAKTYRKHNAGLGLVTQSAADLQRAGLFDIVSEVCPTRIFLANPKADFEAYKKAFHLNDAEVESLRTLKKKKQFMLQKGERPSVVLNLNLSPLELAMYGNSPFENERRDRAIREHGWHQGMRVLAQTA